MTVTIESWEDQRRRLWNEYQAEAAEIPPDDR